MVAWWNCCPGCAPRRCRSSWSTPVAACCPPASGPRWTRWRHWVSASPAAECQVSSVVRAQASAANLPGQVVQALARSRQRETDRLEKPGREAAHRVSACAPDVAVRGGRREMVVGRRGQRVQSLGRPAQSTHNGAVHHENRIRIRVQSSRSPSGCNRPKADTCRSALWVGARAAKACGHAARRFAGAVGR